MQRRTGAASVKPQSLVRPFLLSALACLTLACSGGADSAIRNVLLVSIDTCRADHIGCYRGGGASSVTPNIDAVAAAGVRFEHATSPVPVTLPAHASMFTGTIPPYHGVHDNGQVLDDEANITLAETLKDNGFVTSAVVGALVLSPRYGIDQGFNHFDPRPEPRMTSDRILERRGEDVTRLATEWLDANHEEPFFLFVHYYDPHTVYDPPAPFGERFANDPYTGEIAYVDHHVGRLLERFEQLGLDESTLVVITADHGEMLGEHGEETHTYFVYEGAVRVPLILKGPGIEPRVISDTRAGLVDILPTLAGLLGIEPPDDLDGLDLSPLLTGEGTVPGAAERTLYSEATESTKYGCNPLIAVTDDRFKYIETTRPELYDLTSDPAESVNRAGEDPQNARRLSGALASVLDERSRELDSSAEAPSAEALERLRSLGYVDAGGGRSDLAIDPTLPDPKDVIGFHVLNNEVPILLWNRRYDEARARAEELVRQRPDFYSGHVYLGELALVDEDPAEAVARFRRASELQPEAPGIVVKLGKAQLAAGDPEGAIESFRDAAQLDERSAQARQELALALHRARRYEEAVAEYARVIEIDPEHVEAHSNLADLVAASGNLDQAVALYLRAVQLDPNRPEIYQRLSVALARQGKRSEAADAFARFVELQPDSADLQATLAGMLMSLERTGEAVPHFRRAVELEPDSATRRNHLGNALMSVGQRAEAIEQFRRGAELEPGDATILFNLGLALKMDGQLDEAIRHLRRTLELNPEQPRAQQHLQEAIDARGAGTGSG
jgi:arylsulfatase A-like enzyme/Flp pilus assembly protein TadD